MRSRGGCSRSERNYAFAVRRTKRRESCIPNRRSRKPPLDVARPRATFQIQEIIYFVGQPARTTGTRQSSAAKEISRGDAEPRRMKGGNGESVANVVTLCLKGEIPHCVSRKPPLDVARPRATLQVQEIIYFVGQPARTTGTRQSSAAEASLSRRKHSFATQKQYYQKPISVNILLTSSIILDHCDSRMP